MSNGRKGKLVIQEIPDGEVERKIVRLLLQFAKNASVEELTRKVRRTPYTVSNDIEAEKAALIVEAFEKFGAAAAFVPHVFEEPAVETFTPVETFTSVETFTPVSEPRFVMRSPITSRPSAYSAPVRPQSPKAGARNLTLFLVFILMVLSFGFLGWQIWPFVSSEILAWVSYLKQLF